MRYEYSDAEHVSYRSELGVLSDEEIRSRGLAESFELDIEPEWRCFYPSDTQTGAPAP